MTRKPVPRKGEIIPTRPLTFYAGLAPRALTPGSLTAVLNGLDAGDVAEAMALFDEMGEKDLHLGAVSQTRALAVISKDRDVAPASSSAGDEKIAAFVREVFENLPRKQSLLASLMSAFSHGFSMAEMIWDVSGGQAVVTEIAPRPQKLFTFVDYEDPARLLDFPNYLDPHNRAGIKLPRDKFIFHKTAHGPGDVLKSGLYRGIAWYYLFTNYTVKDWLSFMDIYGIPLRLGKYRPTADEQARSTLKDAVANLGSDAAAVISDDTTIEFIQSAVSGNSALYMDAVEFFNRLKSKRVLGQTLTTEVSGGSGGAYALGKVHDLVRQDILAFDCKALDETLTHDFVRPLVDVNFGPRARYPRVVTRLTRAGESEEKLAQLKTLIELGAQVPARVAAEITGVPLIGDMDSPLSPKGGN